MTWQDRCTAAGGQPTQFPGTLTRQVIRNPDRVETGAPVCRFRDADGVLRYEAADRSFSERLAATLDSLGDASAKLAGAVVEKAEGAVKAVGLDKGIIGVAGKLLGVPPWLIVGLAIGAGYLVLRDFLPRRQS